jgi:hypothetical protein
MAQIVNGIIGNYFNVGKINVKKGKIKAIPVTGREGP